ncbi:MAG: BTAD domain-containing putative transcriptional regulator [Pseudonocardiales bacterium]
MVDDVRFAVLGPLTLRRGRRPVRLGGPRPRALLASLLLRANQLVGVDQLVDRLWGADPPKDARAALQVVVARLRQALDTDAERVRTQPGGYLIAVAPDELDLLRFNELVARAEEASLAGDVAAESMLLTEAVGLWHGPPLTNVSSDLLHREDVAQLAERRLLAEERRIDAGLRLGRHAALIPELTSLTAQHPLRERFWVQLALALYRSGRQAEALATYRSVAKLLSDELGLDPGPELRQLHQAVLTADPTLAVPDALPLSQPWQVHCQLPLDIDAFVGRERLVDQLVELLGSGADNSLPIVALSGSPGVGKSALAIRVAHQLRSAFPDGQWYLQLTGTSATPRSPSDVLAELLVTAGLPATVLPAGLHERAAVLRARLADRRVLLVCDDAASVDQVRPLLPGTAGCGVLVTSRTNLSGLALQGAHHIILDPLSSAEATELLTGLLGAGRVHAEPEAAAELAGLCDHIPLALRIAAANLMARPRTSLGAYVVGQNCPRRRFAFRRESDTSVGESSGISSY